jgi:hypothetical protein
MSLHKRTLGSELHFKNFINMSDQGQQNKNGNITSNSHKSAFCDISPLLLIMGSDQKHVHHQNLTLGTEMKLHY